MSKMSGKHSIFKSTLLMTRLICHVRICVAWLTFCNVPVDMLWLAGWWHTDPKLQGQVQAQTLCGIVRFISLWQTDGHWWTLRLCGVYYVMCIIRLTPQQVIKWVTSNKIYNNKPENHYAEAGIQYWVRCYLVLFVLSHIPRLLITLPLPLQNMHFKRYHWRRESSFHGHVSLFICILSVIWWVFPPTHALQEK